MEKNLKFNYENNVKEVRTLNEIFSPKKGEINIISGIKGHGKINFIDFCCDNLNEEFEYKTLFSTDEERLLTHLDNLSTKKIGNCIVKNDGKQFLILKKEIINNFFFIEKEKNIYYEDFFLNIEKEISKTNANVLVLDSFNIEDYNFNDDNCSEYGKQNKFLINLRKLTRKLNIITFILADTKLIKEGVIPSANDISDNTIFLSSCDTCVTVHKNESEFIIYVEKNRNNENGRTGFTRAYYISENRCFEPKFNHMGLFEAFNETINDKGRDFILPILDFKKTMNPKTNNGDCFYVDNFLYIHNAKYEINIIESEIYSGIKMGFDSVIFNYTTYNNISIFNPIEYYVKLLTDAKYKCEIVEEYDENDKLIQKIKIYLN